jgi:membrane protein implicated in regulation of membrane protease activity
VHPFAKYLLVEVPEWILAGLIAVLLHRWLGLSPVVAALLVALWIGKSIVQYRSVRDAFVAQGRSPREDLVGRTGVVVKPLRPVGMVRVGGELWRAEPASPGASLSPGRRVRVAEVRGLTLRVAEETGRADARRGRQGGGERPGAPGPQAPAVSPPEEASASGAEAGPGGSAR